MLLFGARIFGNLQQNLAARFVLRRNVLDEMHRRELFTAQIRRAILLATTALDARLRIEQVLPRVFLEHAHAHGLELFVLKIDRLERAGRFERPIVIVTRDEEHVRHLAVGEQRQERKCEHQMAPPHDLMRKRKRLRIHAREHEREQIPHWRPERPRVVRAHDAQPFSDETRKQDQQQKHKPHDIDRVSFEMLVGARDTAHERDDDADRAHEAR